MKVCLSTILTALTALTALTILTASYFLFAMWTGNYPPTLFTGISYLIRQVIFSAAMDAVENYITIHFHRSHFITYLF